MLEEKNQDLYSLEEQLTEFSPQILGTGDDPNKIP